MNPWWSLQCPKRGPALSHIQDGTVHCIHCGQFPQPPVATVMPAIDVNARLKQLGLMSENGEPTPSEKDTGMEDVRPEEDPDYDESAPREPKMVTHYEDDGHMPSGPVWERGRSWRGDGRLNPRDYPRLEDIIHRERARGYR